MSFLVELTRDDKTESSSYLATGTGWHDFARWALALSADDYPSLRHLANFGFVDGAETAATQLVDALASHAEDGSEVYSTGINLLAALDGTDDGQTILVVG